METYDKKHSDSTDQYDDMIKSVKEAQDHALQAFSKNNKQQVLDWIDQRIHSYQHVVTGLQMASQISEVGGIAQSAINASIDTLEALRAWIEQNCNDEIALAPAPPPLSDEPYRLFMGEDESL